MPIKYGTMSFLTQGLKTLTLIPEQKDLRISRHHLPGMGTKTSMGLDKAKLMGQILTKHLMMDLVSVLIFMTLSLYSKPHQCRNRIKEGPNFRMGIQRQPAILTLRLQWWLKLCLRDSGHHSKMEKEIEGLHRKQRLWRCRLAKVSISICLSKFKTHRF